MLNHRGIMNKSAAGIYRFLAPALLVFLAGLCIYRAATVSIAVDEAFFWQRVLDGPWSILWTQFEACHHVLFSYLAKLSVSAFGLSELSLRFPALLAAVIYFWGALRLSRWLFGDSARMLLSVAFLSLNPFVLEFLAVARGYGLACACLLWAVYESARYWSDTMAGNPSDGRLVRCSVWLALSVGANLTFLFAAAPLFAANALLLLLWRGPLRSFFCLALPAAAIVLLTYGPLVSEMKRSDFYLGEPLFPTSVLSVALAALLHLNFPHVPAAYQLYVYFYAGKLARLYPWMLVPIAALGCFAARPTLRGKAGKQAWLFALATVALVADVLLVLAAHATSGVLYPFRRTGLHWMLASQLLLLGGWAWLASKRGIVARAAGLACCALVCLIVADFAVFVDAGFYREWPGGALVKTMVERMDRERGGLSHPVVVGGTWSYEPCLNFYRSRWKLDWMLPVEQRPPDSPSDFYLLDARDRDAVVPTKDLEILLEDPELRTCLARPRSAISPALR